MIRFASTLWRLALAALLGIMAYFAFQFGQHAGDWANSVMSRETDRVLASTDVAIQDTRKDLLREVAAWRKDTTRQLDDLRMTADARLSDIALRAEGQTTRANDTLAGISRALEPSLQHIEAVTAHADEASAILLRRDALPAQVLGLTAAAKVTLGETAQTMKTVREVAATEGPATAQAVRIAAQQADGIATDIHTFTTAAVKPVPWYRKIGSILYSGARVGAAIF